LTVARDPILGQLHPDLACAIALGVVDHSHVSVTVDALTLYDTHLRTSRSQTGWLDGDDPLDAATRDFLAARQEAMRNAPRPAQSGWAAASAVKARESANARAVQAKARAWQLLQERGVVSHARRAGLVVTQPGA
jgi:hypothetical protein